MGVDNVEKEKKKVILFPNPTHNKLNIELAETTSLYKNIELTIYSLQGQLIKKQILFKGTSQINIESLPKGIYVFSFLFEEGKVENH